MTGQSADFGNDGPTQLHRWEVINRCRLGYENISFLDFVVLVWSVNNTSYSCGDTFTRCDMSGFFACLLRRLAICEQSLCIITIEHISMLHRHIITKPRIESFSLCKDILYMLFSVQTIDKLFFIQQSQFTFLYSQTLCNDLTQWSEVSSRKS